MQPRERAAEPCIVSTCSSFARLDDLGRTISYVHMHVSTAHAHMAGYLSLPPSPAGLELDGCSQAGRPSGLDGVPWEDLRRRSPERRGPGTRIGVPGPDQGGI